MDLMQLIIAWLKSFIERMKSITSFIGNSYLPSDDEEEFDDGFSFFDKFIK